MEQLLYILANGCGDRIRGSYSVLIGALIFALSTTLLVGIGTLATPEPTPQFAPITWVVWLALAYWLGELKGWGEPLGAYTGGIPMPVDKPHDWQVGALKTNVELALLFRGAMWGFPISVILWFVDPYLAAVSLLAFTTKFIVSVRLAMIFTDLPSQRWYLSELIGGAYIMGHYVIYQLITT